MGIVQASQYLYWLSEDKNQVLVRAENTRYTLSAGITGAPRTHGGPGWNPGKLQAFYPYI